ncbi:MAG: zinc ribbon domain-containing protein [Candidatus Fermentibacteraceae bacterium]|nr:zinc ribbon domain-containing protein [Candidatus Fermentibacteraceae bacterium]
MPIYEYLCKRCNIIFQFLVRHPSKDTLPVCPKCDNKNMERVMSSFSFGSGHSSKSDGLEDDPSLAGLDEEDPKAMARAIRRMADELGEDLGSEVSEALSRLEAGEDPEKIERDLEESGFEMNDSSPSRDGGLYEA